MHNVKGLSIIHVNCRSLNSNFDKLNQMLNDLQHKFDIIAVSETWLNKYNSDLYSLNGFQMYNQDRDTARGGGVAIYVRENIKHTVNNGLSIAVENCFECLTVDLYVPRKITVSCVYRKPGSNIETFSDKIEEMFRCKTTPLYICGDFNVNLLSYENHKSTEYFVNQMFSLALFPLIVRPTRITGHCYSIIDNIFTNEISGDQHSGLIIEDISDHLPVFCINRSEALQTFKAKEVFIRKDDDESMNNFKSRLCQENWDLVYGTEDVNNAYNNFIEIFCKHYNDCCVLRKRQISRKRPDKPWFTQGLRNACRKKNNLYRKFLENRSFDREQRYKRYKNKLTTILRNCERNYYSNLLEKHKNNVKETWKVLNSVINKTKSNDSNFPDTFQDGDKTLCDKSKIAEGFYKFFVGIVPSLASNIPSCNGKIQDYLDESNKYSMYLLETSESEIFDIVQSLDSKTSADHNGVSMAIIKKIIHLIVKPLTHIFNTSFTQGCFPDSMKIARVVPIYKSGDKRMFTNYRPVSLLSQFSKILEKLFDKRLTDFINKYNILCSSQYGFRSGCSTSHALVNLIEDITTALDKRMSTLGVFIDLKKAFDTIDHELLIKKLQHYGFRGIVLEWLKSYLKNRKQYIDYENTNSVLSEIICGVPQGSILGPKLFILYVNDICNVSDILQFVIFADDTNIYYSHPDLSTLYKSVTSELSKLYTWFLINKLSLNLDKTNYILFTNKKIVISNLEVKINDIHIKEVTCSKFLGVLIDKKLTWKEHISNLCNKLSKSIAIIHKVSNLLSSNALYTLYYSLFLPYLNYCLEVWGNTYKSNLMPIF